MDWAGQLVESICGITLEDYIRDNISAPLGITSFTFNPYTNGELSKKVPHLTVRHKGGKLALNPEPLVASGVKDGFGGHGGCASMPDYLKALHSILANDGKLLKPETVEMMFTPQLSEHCVEALRECISSPMGALFIGEWKPEKSKLDWGLGGILLMQDYEAGRRKKGTLCWGGVANTFWIIDRETDLALTFGTQVLPPGDKGAEEMITAVELGVYEMVNREST